ncbi:MAG: DUF1854 domain-containing protein [Hylemonella sp.]|nr:DUF1854 domain-containing protein [Hylemonella sp.]MDH5707716.1 DUF1854 domain-containing protein [Hylemonella sp.]
MTEQPQKSFDLSRNAFGRLVLVLPDGQRFEDVQPVRAFPIQSPQRGIALMTADGHEAAWIDALDTLAPPLRELIRETLDAREFMPEIRAIEGVSSFSTPCTWRVRTDRGDTAFVLRGEEDIRRLPGNTLLITDAHGIHFLIRDVQALGRESRRILDRFM